MEKGMTAMGVSVSCLEWYEGSKATGSESQGERTVRLCKGESWKPGNDASVAATVQHDGGERREREESGERRGERPSLGASATERFRT